MDHVRGPGEIALQATDQYAIDILDVTVDVIECMLAAGKEYLKPSAIASCLRINRTRVFRILKTLERRGYVEVDPISQGYRLGLRFLHVAKGILDNVNLRQEAGQVLKELAGLTGESVSLLVISGLSAICIDNYPGEYLLQITTPVGQIIPLHTGASPKLLLAYLPAAEREKAIGSLPLTSFTKNTITSTEELRQVLDQIVKQGYAVDDQEYEQGAYAIAAPVRDYSGRVIAGLTVTKPEVRFGPEQRETLICQVVEAAARLSHMLGYHPSASEERSYFSYPDTNRQSHAGG
jgi:DNA-binding IclR family transcriptional regulator